MSLLGLSPGSGGGSAASVDAAMNSGTVHMWGDTIELTSLTPNTVLVLNSSDAISSSSITTSQLNTLTGINTSTTIQAQINGLTNNGVIGDNIVATNVGKHVIVDAVNNHIGPSSVWAETFSGSTPTGILYANNIADPTIEVLTINTNTGEISASDTTWMKNVSNVTAGSGTVSVLVFGNILYVATINGATSTMTYYYVSNPATIGSPITLGGSPYNAGTTTNKIYFAADQSSNNVWAVVPGVGTAAITRYGAGNVAPTLGGNNNAVAIHVAQNGPVMAAGTTAAGSVLVIQDSSTTYTVNIITTSFTITNYSLGSGNVILAITYNTTSQVFILTTATNIFCLYYSGAYTSVSVLPTPTATCADLSVNNTQNYLYAIDSTNRCIYLYTIVSFNNITGPFWSTLLTADNIPNVSYFQNGYLFVYCSTDEIAMNVNVVVYETNGTSAPYLNLKYIFPLTPQLNYVLANNSTSSSVLPFICNINTSTVNLYSYQNIVTTINTTISVLGTADVMYFDRLTNPGTLYNTVTVIPSDSEKIKFFSSEGTNYQSWGLVSPIETNGGFAINRYYNGIFEGPILQFNSLTAITSSAVFYTDVLPSVTNTYNLGSPSFAWNNLYVSNLEPQSIIIQPLADGNVFIINNAATTSLLLFNSVSGDLILTSGTVRLVNIAVNSFLYTDGTSSIRASNFNATADTMVLIPGSNDPNAFVINSAAGFYVFQVDNQTPAINFGDGNGTLIMSVGTTNIDVNTSMVPNLSNVYNLGSPSLYWLNGYITNLSGGSTTLTSLTIQPTVDGTVFTIKNVATTNLLTFNTSTSLLNLANLSASSVVVTDASKNLISASGYTSGTYIKATSSSNIGNAAILSESGAVLTSAGSIVPSTTNTYNLGAVGAYWSNEYVKTINNSGSYTLTPAANGIIFTVNNSGSTPVFQINTTTGLISSLINMVVGGSGGTASTTAFQVKTTGNVAVFTVDNTTPAVSIATNLNVGGNIVPSATNTYNLGAVGAYWSNEYVNVINNSGSYTLTPGANGIIFTVNNSGSTPVFQINTTTGLISNLVNTVVGGTSGTASATAFQVKTTGNVAVFTVDNTTPAITLGTNSSSAGNIVPSVTNTYNLGSPSLYWNNAYITNLNTGVITQPVETVSTNGAALALTGYSFINGYAGAINVTLGAGVLGSSKSLIMLKSAGNYVTVQTPQGSIFLNPDAPTANLVYGANPFWSIISGANYSMFTTTFQQTFNPTVPINFDPGSPGANYGSATALSADGNTFAVGDSSYVNTSNNYGGVYVYTRTYTGTVATWAFVTVLFNNTTSTTAMQGSAVAMTPDALYLASGGPGGGSGVVCMFYYTGGAWTNAGKLTGAGSVNFGTSVAMSVNAQTIVVGDTGYTAGIGTVYVYTQTGTTSWSFSMMITPPDYLGTTPGIGNAVGVSANGNTIAIAASNDNSGVGAVWVYGYNAVLATYIELTKMVPTNKLTTTIAYGYSLALSGDGNTLLIGAPLDTTNFYGSIYGWRNLNGFWMQMIDRTSNYIVNERFGYSVAITYDGTSAVVGAIASGASTGGMYPIIFGRNSFYIQNKLNVAGRTLEGENVAISALGDTAAFGNQNNYAAVFV